MPKNYFSNHEAFWQAVKKTETLFAWADSVQGRLGKNPNIDYDHRDLYSLAFLTIDLSNIPEDQQESYFKAEYEKLHDAFDVSDPQNPKRSDPAKVKPYIKKMFDCVLTDLSTVDFNDSKQIEKILQTMLVTQTLAMKVKDYPEVAMELYPTHEDKMRIDAISSKAYAMQLKARVEMSYAGLDDIGKHFKTIGGNARKSTAELLQAELNHKVFDTTLQGSNLVMLDPTANELSAKFFMNESFTVMDDLGSGPEPFTQDEYGKFYVESLADSMMNTSFEYQVFLPAKTNSPKIEQQDLLIINGKPLGQLLAEYQAQGYRWPQKEMMAGQFLREALLKGEPVTLVTSSFTKDGEIRFNNKDIKLDLDKLDIERLNKEHYESYHPFRQWLDKIGLFPIRPPYLTNAQRDAKQEKIKARFWSSHQRKIKNLEKEIVRSYNSIDRTKSTPSGCASVIPYLTRVEAKVKTPEANVSADVTKSVDISKSNEVVRENIKMREFTETKDVKTEPQKTNEEKVVSKNSTVK